MSDPTTTLPPPLVWAAMSYAESKAWREKSKVHVYERHGIVFVRADYEPMPEGSHIIYTAPEERP